VILMPVSYFLAWESPFAEGSLWSTLTIASMSDAKLLLVDENEDGITITFDKEISQDDVANLLFSTITTEGFYTH